MRRAVFPLARAGFAIGLALLASAMLRWAPAYAHSPLDLRAQPLAAPTLVCAVMAALTSRGRRPTRWRPWLLAFAAAMVGLWLAVVARGPVGLAGEATAAGVTRRLRPGPVDLLGADLAGLPRARKWSVHWEGPLRAPRAGRYRLWVDGRGRVQLRVDGRLTLDVEGERLRAGADVFLTAGVHHLEVLLQRTGPGPRLRLGWITLGARAMVGARVEAIPPRHLGETRPAWIWWLTDAFALAVAVTAGLLAFHVPWPSRPGTARRRRTLLPALASVAGHGAVLAAMSWPLVADLAGHGPVDRPDGRLNAWILAWDAHAILGRPASLFQAPIFHPLPDALAFSEHLLLPAVLTVPAQLLGGPVLAYNLVFLLSALGAALGVQLLVLRAGGGALAAFAAGALFAAGPHRWVNLPHLHAHAVAFLPLAALAFDRFWERRTFRRALVVAAVTALQAATSIYMAAATAVLLAAALGAAVLGRLRGREAARLLLALALFGAALVPLARPYFRMRAFLGEEFSLDVVALYAATPESYLASGIRWYEHLGRRHLDPDRVRDPLFPGLGLLLLGVAGLAAAPKRYRVVALGSSALAVVLSLGPETALFRALHEHVVLLRGIRALGRLAVIPVLCLSVLGGLALSGRRAVVVLAALGLGLIEAWPAPLRLGTYAGPPSSARWLAGREGAVADLPLGLDDTSAMLNGIAHFRPLVNGDSGFVPRPYVRVRELLGHTLDDEGLRLLRALDVRHVVSRGHLKWPAAAAFGDERVYEVPPGEAARVIAPGRPACALWSSSGVTVDLGAPAEVGRVVLPAGDGPWCARPMVGLTLDGASWKAVPARASLADATLSLLSAPRAGHLEVRFPLQTARRIRLDACLPVRPGGVSWGG